MAYLHRLIFVALVLLSSWLPSTSYASFPATSTTTCPSGTCTEYSFSLGGWHSTVSAAADAMAQGMNNSSSYAGVGAGGARSYRVGSVSGSTANFDMNSGGGWNITFYSYTATQRSVTAAYSCPVGSTLSGSTCTCNGGLTQSGNTCVDPTAKKCTDAKDGVDLFTGFKSLPTFGASFCPSDGAASACASKVSGGFCVVKAGVKTCTHEVTYTGGTCTPPAPSTTEPNPTPTVCKGTYGQVNGVDVCLPIGTDPAATVETAKKTETTTTPPDGTPSTTTTTDEKATCIGSMCTTEKTTTTTGPDGLPKTTTEKKSESKDDFCKTNPRDPQCVTSSFGGSCSASFTCDGDAIMCAISREQHVRNCKLFDDVSSDEAKLYDAQKNKTGSQTGDLPGSETIAIGSSSFDTSDAIGGGSGCISDKSVTVAGKVVSIPFSSVCAHLAMLGNILLAVSYLLAGRILVRG